jgi:hypothetical protein
MPLILAHSQKTNRKLIKGREISRIKRGRLVQKRVLIKNDQKLLELGFYNDKEKRIRGSTCLQNEDAKVGKLLGISADMVKRYRIRAGYIPNERIINRLKELERASKIEVKIKKFKRKRKVNVSQNSNNS